MYNGIMLTAISPVVAEAAQEEFTFMGFTTDTLIKFGVLFVVIVAISVYFVLKPTEEKKNMAKEFLAKLATNVMQIAFANLSVDVCAQTMNDAISFDYATFKKKVTESITKDSWDFVQTALKYAVENDGLDPFIARLIKEESVDGLVNLVLSRPDMETAIRKAYDLLTKSTFEEIEKAEEEAKKEAEAAEAQPAEPSDPVVDEQTECFTDNLNTNIDDSVAKEIIPDSVETIETVVEGDI